MRVQRHSIDYVYVVGKCALTIDALNQARNDLIARYALATPRIYTTPERFNDLRLELSGERGCISPAVDFGGTFQGMQIHQFKDAPPSIRIHAPFGWLVAIVTEATCV